MPYYHFDKYDKSSLDELAKLLLENGLEEVACNASCRVWQADSSNHVLLVSYNPNRKDPLLVQTKPGTSHENPAIFDILARIYLISNSSQVSEGIAPKIPLDISRFQRVSPS